MYIIARFIFLLSILIPTVLYAGERVLTSEPYNRYKPAHIKSNDKGDIWIAYHETDGKIIIKNVLDGTKHIISEQTGDIAGGLSIDVQGDNIFVVWREKHGDKKKLFLRASYDSGKSFAEPLLLDDNQTEALTRIKISSNSKGDVYIMWYGERPVEGERYHIYCAVSNDFGRTFSRPQNLTLGYGRSIYPTLLVHDSGAYMFSYSRKQDKIYMIFRKTLDGGKTWSEPLEIKEIGIVTLFIEPIKIKDRIHVFWFNSYNGEPIVEGAYSDDDGKTWTTYFLEDTKSFDLGLLRIAGDLDGNVYIALSGKWSDEQKSKVYFIRSNDNGSSWQKMQSIRHYPFENTKAVNPDIVASDKGVVVIAWVDYRNIRSNIYMQYSKDAGRTWQNKDTPLEEPGRFNTDHYYNSKSIVKKDDKYYMLAYRFENDLTLNKAHLLLFDFKLDLGGEK